MTATQKFFVEIKGIYKFFYLPILKIKILSESHFNLLRTQNNYFSSNDFNYFVII